ncbi:uncharacterized protein LOC120916011 [Rana temporaria]|uniref:uncharacterized protein LOC120916011 n=1 Tax=Rana temporaria TaxID=8407 RepID=UPI001AACB672|nr:uncharacterized protein LOC120916011 [Rana temporaria]
MKATFFALCTIPALLSTVSALRCVYCAAVIDADKASDYNINTTEAYCDGRAYNCTSKDPACTTLYISFTKYDNSRESYVKRGCVGTKACNISESISSPWGKSTYSTSCCFTDGCTPLPPVLKAPNKTKNGVLCPACYSEDLYKECKAEYPMHCTGKEKYCLNLRRTTQFDVHSISVSGCSTENFCPEDKDVRFLNRPKYLENHYCNKTDSSPNQRTGHFIWCSICHNYNVNNCEGATHLCSPHDDVCVFEKTRSIYDGMNDVEIVKRCGQSHECNRAGSIRSSTKTILINTTCCDESVCTPPEPILPSIDDNSNGVICPACFVPNSDRCLGRSHLKCTGNEKRCLHYMRTEKQDMFTETQSLHGCTTDEICEAGSNLVVPRGHYYKTVKTQIFCNSAIAPRSESYTSLMLVATALIVFKVDI